MSKIWNSLGLAVLVAALMMGTASAGQTTTATGDVVNTATINVLDIDIGFGNFAIGDNTETTTLDSFISVDTNYALYLQAYEDTGDGKMSVDTHILAAPLKVGIESYTPASLADSSVTNVPVTVSAQIAAETELDYDATFVQPVGITDDVATDYTITVTFSASTTA